MFCNLGQGNRNRNKIVELYEVKPRLTHTGYARIYARQTSTNKRKDLYIHRLVAEYFIDNPENKKYVNHKIGIEKRNLHKRENLNRLAGASIIWTDIPYKIYYMSCNLDHALYGKLNSTDEEKETDSYRFAVKYKDDIPGFLRFISESDFSIMNSYAESWLYIKGDLHSLERHTNLGLCFSAESTQSQMEMKTE